MSHSDSYSMSVRTQTAMTSACTLIDQQAALAGLLAARSIFIYASRDAHIRPGLLTGV